MSLAFLHVEGSHSLVLKDLVFFLICSLLALCSVIELFAALKHAEKEEEEEDGDENFKCRIMLSTLFFLHGIQGDTGQVIEAKGRPSLSSGFLISFVFMSSLA
ncbi:hypothetical protein NC651_034202 [Populus alba x Populus x berolinensis]|nr:hypothetical protein NC651_034202 [Populus alba x Populus x berolinensis]